jgi:hypothetical protein
VRVNLAFFGANVRFAMFILPSTICGSVLTYSLAIIIPRWFDAESAGYFAAAYRIGFFPVSLIAQSLGGVFAYKKATENKKEHHHQLLISIDISPHATNSARTAESRSTVCVKTSICAELLTLPPSREMKAVR